MYNAISIRSNHHDRSTYVNMKFWTISPLKLLGARKEFNFKLNYLKWIC